MKTYTLLLTILLGTLALQARPTPQIPYPQTHAPIQRLKVLCDACGCSANGGSMGFGTGLNNNFVGVRYINQRYRSQSDLYDKDLWNDENFNTLQLWSQIPLGQRIIVNAVLPYHFHSRTISENTKQQISGLGDAIFLAYYQLLKQTPDSIVSIAPQHTLQLGGGVKAPTGEFNRENLQGSVNPSFQLGTGSWDVLVAANYGLTHRNWGLLLTANYIFKSENNEDYRFGNQLNYAVNTYKTYYLGTYFALTPQLGIGGEHFDTDTAFGFAEADTGGNALFGRLGIEARYTRYALGISAMQPLAQDLNNGKVEVKHRLSLYMNLNL